MSPQDEGEENEVEEESDREDISASEGWQSVEESPEDATPPPSLEELEQMGMVDGWGWLPTGIESDESSEESSTEGDSSEAISPESLHPQTSQFPSIEEPEPVETLDDNWFSWTGDEAREEEPPEEVRGNERSVTSQAPPLPTEEASEALARVEGEETDKTPRLESSVLRVRSDVEASHHKSSQPGLESSNQSNSKTPQEETSEEFIEYPVVLDHGNHSQEDLRERTFSQLFQISLEEAEALQNRLNSRLSDRSSESVNVEENLATIRSSIAREIYEEGRANLLGIDRETLLNEPQFESFRQLPNPEEDAKTPERFPRGDFNAYYSPMGLHWRAAISSRYEEWTGEITFNDAMIPTYPNLLRQIEAGLLREKALLEHNLSDNNINRLLGSDALNHPQRYTQLLRISNLLLENLSEEELQNFSLLENYEETTLDDGSSQNKVIRKIY